MRDIEPCSIFEQSYAKEAERLGKIWIGEDVTLRVQTCPELDHHWGVTKIFTVTRWHEREASMIRKPILEGESHVPWWEGLSEKDL